MKKFEIVSNNPEGGLTSWGLFDHHELIEVLPYFMKLRDPELLNVRHINETKGLPIPMVYSFFKHEGKYDD